jgi:glycosyltransferase involved in cell wall biosynthesis
VSAVRQTLQPLEILVIDDGSSDDTREVVDAMAREDPRIRLIRLERRLGAAAARNAGIRAASGHMLAFLDSDDEWMNQHLEQKVRLLMNSGAELVFGSFYRNNGRTMIEQRCPPLLGPPLEYLFLSPGDFRTSTFVCARASAVAIMFDDDLLKHQDWDFMINFHRHFRVTTDTQSTVIAHTGGVDRMSVTPNHQATEQFFRKNRPHCSTIGWVLFAAVMLAKAFQSGGKGPFFQHYLQLIREIDPGAHGPIRSLTPLLHVPRIGSKLFRAACRTYLIVTARRRRIGGAGSGSTG